MGGGRREKEEEGWLHKDGHSRREIRQLSKTYEPGSMKVLSYK